MLQPSRGVPAAEQAPPLPARGQSASRWQVARLCVEQVPMLGQLPPGFAHRTFVPYLHVPVDAHGCWSSHDAFVAVQTPDWDGQGEVPEHDPPV